MVTPNDIATKDFKKVAVGYSPEEVDNFLDDIYEDYERLFTENRKNQMKEEVVPTDSERIKNMEKALERTLALAETAAAEIKDAAHKEADQIVQGARLQADQILSDTRMQNYEMEKKISVLKDEYNATRTRIKALLEAQLDVLKDSTLPEQKQEDGAAEKMTAEAAAPEAEAQPQDELKVEITE